MGLAGVQKAVEERERKRKLAGQGGKNWLKIDPGDEVTVRPLESGDDFHSAYVHSVQVTAQGKKQWRDVVCLDQEGKGRNACPGCEERAKIADQKNDRRFQRRFKFFLNVIWRNGPIYEKEKFKTDDGQERTRLVRNQDGSPKEKGRGDVLALWSGGIRAAEELDHADTKYGGLTSRDFTIERDGEGLDTKYRITPKLDDDGEMVPKAPLSDDDEKIVAEKYELDPMVAPPDYDNYFESVQGGGGGGAGGEGPSDEQTRQKESPFRRRSEQ